jgi:hypothetical protein
VIEPGDVGGIEADADIDVAVVGAAIEHLAMVVEPGEASAFVMAQPQIDGLPGGGEPAIDLGQQCPAAPR